MYWYQCKDIAMVFSFVLVAVFVHYSVAKPLEYNGYPEENRKLNNPLLFEGDMLLTPYQKQLLSGGDVSLTMGRKRGALKPGSFYRIWPNGKVPYIIESRLSAYGPAIEHAMREWENGTCIRFIPRTNEPNYLKIRYGQGCFTSVIGFASYPALPLTLGTGCYSHGTILHELGHAIGFFHEQSRPDRDNYVNIIDGNILSGKHGQFAKYPDFVINSLGEAYDYNSIMHYGPKAFSKAENLFTITSKNPNVTLKKNDHISDADIVQTNKLYNCASPAQI